MRVKIGKRSTNTGTVLGALFLIGLAIYGIVHTIHFNLIKSESEFKYTIATIDGDCVINSTLGNKFIYRVNEKEFNFCTIDQDFRNFEKGKSFIIRYYLDDPSAYDLLTIEVPDSIPPPDDGWNSIPQF